MDRARLWHAATAACVLAGVALSVVTAVRAHDGAFSSATARGLNTFVFFTVQSNLLVGWCALLLAVRPRRTSPGFAVLRHTSLVAITVTGVVYHVALSGLLELDGLARAGDQLVHTVVPVLAVGGWLLFGPRCLDPCSARLALCFPVAWLAFTLVRGAVVPFYPYPFVDVAALGYAAVALNCLWVALLFFALASVATVIDRRLAGSRDRPATTA